MPPRTTRCCCYTWAWAKRHLGKRAPDLGDGDALEGVHDEHARDEVARAVGQVRRQVVDAALWSTHNQKPRYTRVVLAQTDQSGLYQHTSPVGGFLMRSL